MTIIPEKVLRKAWEVGYRRLMEFHRSPLSTRKRRNDQWHDEGHREGMEAAARVLVLYMERLARRNAYHE